MFFISFLVVYGLLHYYVFHRLASVFQFRPAVYFSVLAVFFLLAIWGIAAQILSRGETDDGILKSLAQFGYVWAGTLSITVTLFFLTDLIFIFFRSNQFIYYATVTVCAASVLFSAFSAFNVRSGFTVKNIFIDVPSLSADKVTIVQLSDMHIDAFTSYESVRKIINAVNDMDPDVVALTGDILEKNIDGKYALYGLDGIKSKYGIFAVNGNHEYYAGMNSFNSLCAGINARIVHNQNVLVNGTLYIAGVPDSKISERTNFERADVEKAFNGIDFSKPVIFLSHRPGIFAKAASYPLTLQLSGHTHAGQIPPFDLIECLFFKYFYGLYKKNDSYLYVTSGARWWGPPMRLFSRNEIVKITLYGRKFYETAARPEFFNG